MTKKKKLTDSIIKTSRSLTNEPRFTIRCHLVAPHSFWVIRVQERKLFQWQRKTSRWGVPVTSETNCIIRREVRSLWRDTHYHCGSILRLEQSLIGIIHCKPSLLDWIGGFLLPFFSYPNIAKTTIITIITTINMQPMFNVCRKHPSWFFSTITFSDFGIFFKGLPQFGQVGACSDTSLLQSGHFIKAIFSDV